MTLTRSPYGQLHATAPALFRKADFLSPGRANVFEWQGARAVRACNLGLCVEFWADAELSPQADPAGFGGQPDALSERTGALFFFAKLSHRGGPVL